MNDVEVNKAVKALKRGDTILYPSDTIWGIGCDALNKKAINKIYSLKQRFDKKNLIILASNLDQVSRYVLRVPDIVPDLIASMQKPLTIVYPEAVGLPDNLIAEDGSIGIRVVKNLFCEQLISAFGRPIVSTSANIGGMPAPLTYGMINPYIINGVDHIIKVNQEGVTEMKPSTIIRVDYNNQFTIIRE
jgi:L-threonylcarbamoyladenylate synthase